MKNILYEGYLGPRLPTAIQKKRVEAVVNRELSPCQREILTAYYFQGKTIARIAEERGVNKSTVCRTLHRAEKRLQKLLRY